MKTFISNLLLAISLIGITPTHSMVNEDITILEGIKTLPQDLKRYIVFLVLELALSDGYEKERTIETNCYLGPFAFSSQGNLMLTGKKETAFLWDVHTGEELLVLLGHEAHINTATFSPDGRTALTGSWDKTARLWDSETGNQLQVFTGHTSQVTAATMSSDGKTVITGSHDGPIHIWDSETGKQLQVFTGHTSQITAVAMSSDGKTVLTGSHDKTARLWSIETGQQLQLQLFAGHTESVTSVAFNLNGKAILTGSNDKTARLWDIETGQQLQVFKGHTYWINAIAVNAEGKTVLTGSWDNTARLWDAQNGKELALLKHEKMVLFVAFAPDSQTIITAQDDRTIILWKRVLLVGNWVEKRKESAWEIFKDQELKALLVTSKEPIQ